MGRAPRSGSRFAPRALPARAVSVLALVLAFASQLSVLVHMAAVKHETCAEHGELVEAHGAPRAADAGPLAHTDARADTATATSTDAPHVLSARSTSDDIHDHCPLGTMPCVDDASLVLAGGVALPGPRDDVAAPLVRIVRHSVLHAAPKTSPPAAA